MHILLVEDDTTSGKVTQKYLQSSDCEVDWVQDGESALSSLEKGAFDCLLLDIGLPKIMGLDVLKQARSRGFTLPIIMLTVRNTSADKVEAFDAGADDFLSKPFQMQELKLRISAKTRCATAYNHRLPNISRTGHLYVDPKAHKVMFANTAISVPRREFALLACLMAHLGQVVPYDKLLSYIYGWEKNTISKTLEVHVCNVRKKLKAHIIAHEDAEQYISTVRGKGYVMNEKPYATYFALSKGQSLFSVQENTIYLYRSGQSETIYALVVDDKKSKKNLNVSAITPPHIVAKLQWPAKRAEKTIAATELPASLMKIILAEHEKATAA